MTRTTAAHPSPGRLDPTPPPDGHPRRWLILAIMCLALIVTGLDTLIVTIALPVIGSELGATASQLQWVVDAYAVAYAVPREAELLRHVGGGPSTDDIAGTMFLTCGTVRNYLSIIMTKLDATTRDQAVATAREHGWL
ncbi:MAG: LuxR C-terminal-related transcriptional regulator [Actinomycetales bacterium]